MKNYSLKKVHNLYYSHFKWYQKRKEKLSSRDCEQLEKVFSAMEEALAAKDRKKANAALAQIELITDDHEEKRWWDYPLELAGTLLFALVFAVVIRQMVFEPYQIPSGSMRPSFEEKDHLVVSKTTFGINIPLTSGHLYFDPSLVERGGVITFSGKDLDMADIYDRYFWLFPAYKRFIKRLMGKPGDSLYFYGGMIYGVDKEGNPIKEYLEPPYSAPLMHVPFLSFEGRVSRGSSMRPGFAYETLYKHINRPVGRLSLAPSGLMIGEVFNGERWVKDNPLANKQPHDSIETYGDFLGIKNFAMARVLSKSDLKEAPKVDAPLYLELAHNPYLPSKSIDALNGEFRYSPNQLTIFTSVIPLNQQAMERIRQTLYTARFTVDKERAFRFDLDGSTGHEIKMPGIPDGTYEFYYGKGYSVGFGGYLSPLPEDHPLYSQSPSMLKALFNFGLEPYDVYDPSSRFGGQFPNRYAFYRDGDLYVMDGKIFNKEDPTLVAFVENEKLKSEKELDYLPFLDEGAPVKADGSLDIEKIKTFGYTLPEKSYLALGDNYAMSGDSRTFGPVPQDNLEGTPLVILWPPQERFGTPQQTSYQYFTFPTLFTWGLFFLGITIATAWGRRKKRLPLFKKSS